MDQYEKDPNMHTLTTVDFDLCNEPLFEIMKIHDEGKYAAITHLNTYECTTSELVGLLHVMHPNDVFFTTSTTDIVNILIAEYRFGFVPAILYLDFKDIVPPSELVRRELDRIGCTYVKFFMRQTTIEDPHALSAIYEFRIAE